MADQLLSRVPMIALSKWNQYHTSLQVHGTVGNTTQCWVLCHNLSNAPAASNITSPDEAGAVWRGRSDAYTVNQLHAQY